MGEEREKEGGGWGEEREKEGGGWGEEREKEGGGWGEEREKERQTEGGRKEASHSLFLSRCDDKIVGEDEEVERGTLGSLLPK